MEKPQTGQAVSVHLNGQSQIDFSAISSEKLTFVRIGDRLIILFDNQSTITIDPVFGSDGKPLADVAFEMASDRVIDGSQFAALFPITTDQSVLPAAGTPGAPGVPAGANFSGSPTVDSLGTSSSPLALLSAESFGGSADTNGNAATSTPIPGISDSVILNEDGLPDGIAGGAGDTGGVATSFTGSLHVNFGTDVTGRSLAFATAQPGLSGLTSGGQPVLIAIANINGVPTLIGYVGSDPGSTANQVFVITLDANSTIDGTYTVTLLRPLDHPVLGTEDTLSLTIAVIAIDGSGDAAPVSIVFSVNDDSPAAAAVATTDVAEHIAGNGSFTSSTVTASLGISWGADSGNSVVDGGSNGAVVLGDRSLVFAAGQIATLNALGLTSNGETISYSLSSNGTTIVATAGSGESARTIFTVTLSDQGTGSYSVALLDNIDHVGSHTAVQPLVFTVVATDADGDPVTTTFAVDLGDDVPVIGTPATTVVDEDGLGNAGNSYDDGKDVPGEALSATGGLGIVWGADDANSKVDGGINAAPLTGDRAVTFAATTVANLEALHLTSNGDALSYTLSADGTSIVATAGSGESLRTVFTVTLSDQGAGSYSFKLADNLDHPVAGSEDTITLTFGFVATDSDGDTVTSSFAVLVNDDAPVANTSEATTVAEVDLHASRDLDSRDREGHPGPPVHKVTVTGDLAVAWGADDNNSGIANRSVSFTHSSAADDIHVRSGEVSLDGLTSDGRLVKYTFEDGKLVGYTGSSLETGERIFEVSLSDDGSGSYTFTLFGNLDHPDGEGNNVLNLSFDYTATDSDGDSVTNTFTVTVVDDVPTIGKTENETVSEVNLPTDLFDVLFPDAPFSTVQTGHLAISWGADDNDSGANNNRSVAFTTTSAPEGLTSDGYAISYSVANNGTLLIATSSDHRTIFTVSLNDDGDGSYRFTLYDNIDHPGAGSDSLSLTFGFAATDSDGDTATSSFDVRIVDDVPTIGRPENETVSEASLPTTGYDWSHPDAPNSTVQVGDLDISWGADNHNSGVGHNRSVVFTTSAAPNGLTSDGSAISYSLSSDGTKLTAITADNRVVFTVQLSDSGDGSYTFTLYDNIDHAPWGPNDASLALTFGFQATDSDGDTATSSFKVTVLDTQPVAFTGDWRIVDEDDLSNGTDTHKEPTTVAGDLNIDWGADDNNPTSGGGLGDRSVAFRYSTASQNVTVEDSSGHSLTLRSDGQLVKYAFENGVLVGYTGTDLTSGTLVFEVSLSDQNDGSYTFRLLGNLDHPGGAGENLINLAFSFTATDGDGDTSSNSFTVSVRDDVPVIGSPTGATLTENATGSAGAETFEAQTATNVSLAIQWGADDSNAGSANRSVAFASSIHTDDTVRTTAWGNPALTSNGVTVQFIRVSDTEIWGVANDNGNQLTLGDRKVFHITLSDDGSGSYTFELLDNVDHLGTGQTNALSLRIGFVASDADGDPASSSFVVTINDDNGRPSIGTTESKTVDEDGLSGGNTAPAPGDVSGADTAATGSLAVSWGADDNNAGSVNRSLAFSGITNGQNVSSDAGLLTIDGVQVKLWVVGNTLYGYTGSNPPNGHTAPPSANQVFKVTLDDSGAGSYTFTLLNHVDHPDGLDENDLKLTFGFTATDADGDSAASSFTVTINDDSPVATAAVLKAAVYENELSAGTHAGNNDDQNSDGGGNDAAVKGSLSSLVSVGADTPATFVVEATALSTSLTSLTSAGVALTYTVDTATNTLTAWANGSQVFTFAVDSSSGAYTFTLKGPLDHIGAGNNDALTLDLSTAITVRDSDGDTLPLHDQLLIAVNDDVPSIATQASQPVTELSATDWSNAFQVQSLTGVSLGISWGADNANPTSGAGTHDRSVSFDAALDGAIATATSNGYQIVYAMSADGQSLTAYRIFDGLLNGTDGRHYITANGGDLGTSASNSARVFTVSLSDAGNGTYNFALYSNLDHAAGNDSNTLSLNFGFAATDSDGDTATGSFAVVVKDDLPQVTGTAETGSIAEHDLETGPHPSTFGDLGIDWNADSAKAHLTFTSTTITDDHGNALSLSSGGVALAYQVRLAANGIDQELVAYKSDATIDDPVFVVALNAAGHAAYAFTLFQPLDHLGSYGDTLPLTFSVTGYDGDNDPVAQTFTVNVVDWSPQSEDVADVSIEEAAGSVSTGAVDLKIDFGPDGDSVGPSVTFRGTAPSFVQDQAGNSVALTSLGIGLNYLVSADGTTLTAYRFDGTNYIDESGASLGSDVAAAANAKVFVVTLSDAGTGSYTFTLLQPLDHPAPTGSSQYLAINFGFDIQDRDGDVFGNNFTVQVDAAGTLSPINYSALGTGVFVNLSDDAVTLGGQTVAGHTATDLASGGGHVVGIDQMGTASMVTGSSAADVLVGGAGNNKLFGGAGDDTLIGGGGYNTVQGQAGNDTIIYNVADAGHDTVDGGADTDTQIINGTSADETFNINAVSLGPVSYLAAHLDTSVVAADSSNYQVATTAVEEWVVNGGGGNDIFKVTGSLLGTGLAASTLTINAGTGNDVLDLTSYAGDVHVVSDGGDGGDRVKLGFAHSAATFTKIFASDQQTLIGAEVTYNGVTYTLTNYESFIFTDGTRTLPQVFNTPPVANDDVLTTDEDTALNIDGAALIGNDTDVDNNTLTVVGVSNAVHGTVSLNNGNPIFTADADFSGVAGFDYTIDDGFGGTATAHVTVDVAPIADAPVLEVDTTVTGLEDAAAITIPIHAVSGDSDNSETLRLILSGYPTGATFSVGHAGTTPGTWVIDTASDISALAATPLTLTPPLNYNGSFDLKIAVEVTDSAVLSDGQTHTDVRTFSDTTTVVVTPVNDVPTIGGTTTGDVTEDVVAAGTVVADETFDSNSVGDDAGWSNGWVDETTGASKTNYLTESDYQSYDGGQSISHVYQNANPGKPATITFDFYKIDRWSGDQFLIFLNGEQAIAFMPEGLAGGLDGATGSFTLQGSGLTGHYIITSSGSDGEFANSAGSGAGDRAYHITIQLDAAPAQLTLGFGDTITSSSYLDTFGIDNLKITTGTGLLVAQGALTISDPDAGEAHFIAQTNTTGTNGFGTFTLAADGHWTYTANNSNPAIQALGSNGTLTDSFTAVSADGTASQLVTVTIHGTNDAPVVTAGDAASFTEGSAPVLIGASVTLGDIDSPTLSGASVKIATNFTAGEDQLIFADQNGITGLYDATTGTLTLIGTASIADYQAALRSVTYLNTSTNPSAATRTLSFQVDDGDASNHLSNVATATVAVTPVADAPVNTLPATAALDEDASVVFKAANGNAITVSDIDSSSLTVTLTATNGVLTLGAITGLSFSGGDGTGDAVMTFTGTAAAINAALEGLVFKPTANYSGPAAIEVKTTDGVTADIDTIAVSINAVADAPTIAVSDAVYQPSLSGASLQLNTVSTGFDNLPSTAALKNGGFVAAWQASNHAGDDSNGIYAQLFDAQGHKTGGEIHLNTYTTDTQQNVKVAALGDGGFVAVWASYDQDGSAFGVYARIFDASGNAVSAQEFRVNTGVTANQQEPDIAVLADGSFVITWSSAQAFATTGYDIYSQHYTADGTPIGGETLVNTVTTDFQVEPAITALAGGGYVITWTDGWPGMTATRLKAQLFAADGTPVGSEFLVDSTAAHSDVTALSGGGFVVSAGNKVVIYDATGHAVGSVPTSAEVVLGLADGGFMVGWTTSNGLYVHRYDATGASLGTDVLVNGGGYDPQLSQLASGDVVVSWYGGNSFGRIVSLTSPIASEDQPFDLPVTISLTDTNGTPAEVLATVRIHGLPAGFTLATGERENGDPAGDWIIDRSTTTEAAFLDALAAHTATLTVTGAPNYNGAFQLTITASSQEPSNGSMASSLTTVVPVMIAPAPDAPVNTLTTAAGNEEAVISLASAVSVHDIDGDLASTKLSVAHGTLHIDLSGGATLSAGANDSATLTLAGTEAQINAALQTLSYKGDLNFNGNDTLTVVSTDSTGLSDTDAVVVQVNPVNDLPTAVADTGAMTEDTGSKTFNVLGNDTLDPDAGAANNITLGAVQVAGLAGISYGPSIDPTTSGLFTISVTADNQIKIELVASAWSQLATGATAHIFVGYTLHGDGTDTTYNVLDVTVTGVNDAPVLNDAVLSISTVEDAGVPVGNVGTAVSALVNPVGGSVGNVADPDALSSFPPGIVVTGIDLSHGALYWSSNGGTSWNIVSNLPNGFALYLQPTDLIYFKPNADYAGTIDQAVTFHAWDRTNGSFSGVSTAPSEYGGTSPYSTATDTIAVNVAGVNDAPVNTVPGAPTVVEDTGLSITGLSISDIDAGNGTLTTKLSVQSGTLTVLSAGGASVSGSGTATVTLTGTVAQINTTLAAANNVVYKGTADFNGSDTLSMTTNDGGNSGSGGAKSDVDLVTINVTAVNDAPVAGSDSLSAIKEDSGVRIISFASLLGNDSAGPSNESSQTLTITAISNVVGGTAVISGTNILFTPTANYNGPASFDYTVKDNGQTNGADDFKSATGHASFSITSVADAPVGTSNTVTTLEDNGYTFKAADFGFTDPLDTPANNFNGVVISTLPGAGTLTNHGVAVTAGSLVSIADINAGYLVFTPAANANGSGYASFTFQVHDDGAVNGQSSRLEFQLASGWTGTSGSNYGWGTLTQAPVYSTDQTAVAFAESATGSTIRTDSAAQPNAIASAGATYHLTFDHLAIGGYGAGSIGIDVYAGTTLIGHFTHNYNGTNPTVSFDTTTAVPLGEDGHSLSVVFSAYSAFALDNVSLSQIVSPGVYGSNLLVNGDFGPGSYYIGDNVDATPRTMTVNVTPVNDLPVAVNDNPDGTNPNFAMTEDATSAAFNVLANDTLDPDAGAANSVTISSVQIPTNYLGIDAADIKVTVDPDNKIRVELVGSDWQKLTPGSYLNIPISYTLQGDGSDASTATLIVRVNGANDAPVLTDADLTMAVVQNAGYPPAGAGTQISSFVDLAGTPGGLDNVSDADSYATGIAVTGLDSSHGTWYFSTDGNSWAAITGTVSEAHALLLYSNYYLYFQPTTGYTGTISNGVTFHAWDGSSGTPGNFVDLTSIGTGGSTAYSSATDSVAVTVAHVNHAPVITSDGGGDTASLTVAENTTAVTTVTATDADGDARTYSILQTAGTDYAKFQIDGQTGALRFVSAPDFENPTDVGGTAGDNIYQVNVQVSDGHGGTDTQAISVRVTDVAETPVAVAANDTIAPIVSGWSWLADNGHIYRYYAVNVTWSDAVAAAAGQIAGASYLATSTSAAEDAFIDQLMGSGYRTFLGGSDATTEGTWVWTTGPEAGTTFWVGTASGAAVGGAYVDWASGNPSGLSPNNEDEDFLATDLNHNWNDVSATNSALVIGYTAEAGGAGTTYAAITEDTPFSFSQSWLLSNDTGAPTTISSVSATSSKGAAVGFNPATGMITYDASGAAALQALGAGQTTTDTFTYTIDNGQGGSSTATVTLTVTGVNDRPTAVADTLSFTATAPSGSGWVYNAANGHYYKLVSSNVTFADAVTGAAAQAPGAYLLTLTSAAEQNFVLSNFSGGQTGQLFWLGASDSATEGTWRWVTGPEAGTTFWIGTSTGAAVGGAYAPWNIGEPNNWGGDEDYAALNRAGGSNYATPLWNDAGSSLGTDNRGYIVEWGGMPDNGGVSEDATQTFSTSLLLANDSDPDSGDTLSIVGLGASGVLTATTAKGATVTLNTTTGQITYDPTGAAALQALGVGATTTDSFTYVVSDGHGGTALGSATLTVNGTNDAPVGKTASLSVVEDVTRVLTLADFGYSDIDGDAMRGVTITALSINASVGTLYYGTTAVAANQFISAADIAAGMLSFLPTDNAYSGSGSIQFKVMDINGASDAAARTLTLALDGTDRADTADTSSSGPYSTATAPEVGYGSYYDYNSTNDTFRAGQAAARTYTALNFLHSGDNLEITWSSSSGSGTATLLDQYVTGSTNHTYESFYFWNTTSSSFGGGNFASYALTATFTLAVADDMSSATSSVIVAGTGAGDTLSGGSQADMLFGNGGNDTLNGNAGNDLLVGGLGNDTLYGGLNDDTYIFGLADGNDTVFDSGGTGDRIVIKTNGATMSDLFADDTVNAANSGDLFIHYNGQSIDVQSQFAQQGYAVNYINFDGGTVYGFALGSSNYTLDITDGTGTTRVVDYSSSSTSYFLAGELGRANSISGGYANDLIFGGDQNDTLNAGGGNNLIVGGKGNDALSAGAGNDVYAFNLTDGNDTITDTAGTDSIYIATHGVAMSSLSAYDDNVGTTTGNLVIGYNGQQITVTNHFTGANSVETINFDGGSVYGYDLGTGNYAVSNSDSADVGGQRVIDLSASSANNFVAGENGSANAITGGSGRDLLFGGSLADALIGGSGDDLLEGGLGDDVLTGGIGSDALVGGGGSDTFKWLVGDLNGGGVDSIVDFETGSSGDVLDLSGLLASVSGNHADAIRFVDGANHTSLASANGAAVLQDGDLTLQVNLGSGWTNVATIRDTGANLTAGDDVIKMIIDNSHTQMQVHV